MRDRISVRQNESGVFTFVCEGQCVVPEEIRLLKTPDKGNGGEKGIDVPFVAIQEPDTAKSRRCVSFQAEIPNLDYRPFFLIRENGREYITAERTLPVGGMNNFRDMGGYETCDGRTVSWGKLYRSGHFNSATDEGLLYLKKLGIRTIIDYRSRDEIEKYPNREVTPGIRTLLLDPEAHAAELSAQFTSSKKDEDINLVKKIIEQKERGALTGRYDIVMEQYKNFVEKDKCRNAFSRMLDAVAKPDAAAVVQHCRGGKDRTGFGSMLLLGVLGVDRETIISDYMLTGENRVGRNQTKMKAYRRYTNDPEVLGYLYSLIETRREFIEASYDRIVQIYGSIEGYVKDGLGIGSVSIASIRENYLV